jgi:hypothetical protein
MRAVAILIAVAVAVAVAEEPSSPSATTPQSTNKNQQKKNSRFPLLRLSPTRLRILLIPAQLRLIPRPRTQRPRLDQETLRLVDVVLVLHLLDADAHAVFGEHDVFALHFVGCGDGDFLRGEVDLVADDGEAEEEEEEDDEGEELAVWG